MMVLPSARRMGRIDRRTASKNAALVFSIRCQRSCNLHRLRCCPGRRLAVSAAAVARDDGDLRMARQPSFDGGGLAVREKIDDTASFEIADDAAVALPTLPRPVVDADDVQGE